MARKLFCELHPLAYKLAVIKGFCVEKLHGLKIVVNMQKLFSEDKLPQKIYTHSSLIRRKLGDVDMRLQNNKAINLSLAAPKN